MTADMRPVMCIVGTRPNYMKIAPILRAFDGHVPPLPYCLVHTGQHYDPLMEEAFFQALAIATPDFNLKAGSASHAVQTARIMERLDPVVDAVDPGSMLVVGDVNSTLAAALVAAKRHLPLIHVEAGLRSGDRTMPEEINRILTDQVSDLLFTTERGAAENLKREGIDAARIEFVGNVMIDTLERHRGEFKAAAKTLADAGCSDPAGWLSRGIALVTLHRPSNVDDPQRLRQLVEVLNEIGEEHPLVFPVHPRTRKNLVACGATDRLDASRWLLIDPLPYFDLLGLMNESRLVLTDSGGIQEESTVLGVRCLTLRDNTERPVTVAQGSNVLAGTEPAGILRSYREHRASGAGQSSDARRPELWDGHAAIRIADCLWRHRRRFLRWQPANAEAVVDGAAR